MPKAKPRLSKAPVMERELTKWSCSLFGKKSEIDVFVESTGRWETAAEIRGVGRFDAEEVAAYIMEAVTAHRNNLHQVKEAPRPEFNPRN